MQVVLFFQIIFVAYTIQLSVTCCLLLFNFKPVNQFVEE